MEAPMNSAEGAAGMPEGVNKPTLAEQIDRLRPNVLTGEEYLRWDYARRINPAWSDPGDPVGNLLAEIADMYARRELLSPADERFLGYVITKRIRTFRDKSSAVYLTERQLARIDCLTKRFTHAHLADKFLRIKAMCGDATPGVYQWAAQHADRKVFRRDPTNHADNRP